MDWLTKLYAVRVLRAEIATYRRVALPLLIAFIVCLSSGTGLWMQARVSDAASRGWLYPITYLWPASYFGKNIVLMLYMLLLLGAGHLSLRESRAQLAAEPKAQGSKNPFVQYWIQGFGWFVHTILLFQLALVPLLSSNIIVFLIGLVILSEMSILAAVPATLAHQGGELMDAIVCAHKAVIPCQIKVQAQLWGVAIAACSAWLVFVFVMVRVCLPAQGFEHFHARTLCIAAQMAWLGLLPLHALASVRFMRQRISRYVDAPDATMASKPACQ